MPVLLDYRVKVTVNRLGHAHAREFTAIQNIRPYPHEFPTSVFANSRECETVYKVCSNSTTMHAEPHVSIFTHSTFQIGDTAEFVHSGTSKERLYRLS